MAKPRIVDFNALPRAARERLIDSLTLGGAPAPIVSNTGSVGAAVTGWTFLGLSGLAITYGVFSSDFGRRVQGGGAVAGYAIGLALMVIAVLRVVRRVKLQRALPFPPGRYILPMDFVDARDRMLRLIPMGSLVDFRGVHQHTNGAYTGTSLTFTFEGGVRETFGVNDKARAERVLVNLRESQARIRQCLETRDVNALQALDPLLDVRIEDGGWEKKAPVEIDGPVAHALPAVFRTWAVLGVAAAVGLGGALPLFYVRNLVSDEAMYRTAVDNDSVWGFQSYLATGRRHADEVRGSLLPRAAFKKAAKSGTVTALRSFLTAYPASCVDDDAKAALHGLFTKTLADFRDQSSTADPRLLPFMEKLVGYLEAHPGAHVEARFHSPSSAALDVVDALLKSQSGAKKIIPVGPHFDLAHSTPREANIVKGLQAGFSAIFPADIMTIDQGRRITVEPTPAAAALPKTPAKGAKAKKAPEPPPKPVWTLGDLTAPTLELQYRVGWTGDVYSEEKSERRFVGIVIDFDVSMRIPDEPETFDFSLQVEPPDHFTVRYSSGIGGPTEGQVYDEMAQRAFDQLTDKLRAVFFRPGSKAFEGARPASDARDAAPAKPTRPTGRTGTPR
jgi:hypothetical protein